MPSQRLPAGEPIARGNTSDLWPWTEQTVIKVLRPDIPYHWAEMEADTVARVHAAGLPVPATEGVVDLGGRVGLVLERIDGIAMWERMKTDPRTIPGLVGRLLDLQTEVQRTAVPGLTPISQRLLTKIGEVTQLPADERQEASRMLAVLPAGDALCHGDFHPANVVMAERGMVILDWFDAAVGDATADFVRSSLLMRPPTDRSSWLAGATPELLDQVHSHYITELVRRGSIEPRTFGSWEAVMAVARMSEPVPDGDLLAVWERWRANGPSAARTLLEDSRARVEAPDSSD